MHICNKEFLYKNNKLTNGFRLVMAKSIYPENNVERRTIHLYCSSNFCSQSSSFRYETKVY